MGTTRLGLLQDRFSVDGDIHDVAHNDTAFIKQGVPTDAKILAIDGCLGKKSRASPRPLIDTIFPPRSIPLPQITNLQNDFAGNAPDGQLAGQEKIAVAHDVDLVAGEGYL